MCWCMVMVWATLSAGAGFSWAGEPMTKQARELIPQPLSVYLKERLPNFVPVRRGEAMKELLQYFGAEIKQPSPFVCSGDFNGDGLEDFALVLRDKVAGTLNVVAFHQTERGRYVHFILEQTGKFPVDEKIALYIVCEKPGKKQRFDGPVFELKNDGITSGVFEKASELYYFDNGQYKSVITGD